MSKYPSAFFLPEFLNYRFGEDFKRVLLPLRSKYPSNIHGDTSIEAEYVKLAAFIHRNGIHTQLSYDITTLLSDILLNHHLGDVNQSVINFDKDVLERNLKFSHRDMSSVEYSGVDAVDKVLYKNISNSLGRRVLPGETFDAQLIYPGLKTDNYVVEETNSQLLQRCFNYAMSVNEGRLFSAYRYAGSSWLAIFQRNVAKFTKGVTCLCYKNNYVPSIISLGLFQRIYKHFGDICNVKDNKQQLTLLADKDVLDMLALLVAPLSRFTTNPSDLLPYYIESDGTLSRTLTLNDVSLIPVRRRRLNLLKRDYVTHILRNVISLVIVPEELIYLNPLFSFVCLCIYYGIEGTCSVRKTPRNRHVSFTKHDGVTLQVDMILVERFFDELQRNTSSYSVRRAFMGTIISDVNTIYDYFRCQFYSRWLYNPFGPKSSKDYVDFFKYNQDGPDIRYLKGMKAYSGVVNLRGHWTTRCDP